MVSLNHQRSFTASLRFVRNIRTQTLYDNIAKEDSEPPGHRPLGLSTPRQLVQYLDEFIVGQYAPKKVLSVAVYNHYNRVRANLLSTGRISKQWLDGATYNDGEGFIDVISNLPIGLHPHPHRLLGDWSTRSSSTRSHVITPFEKSNILVIGPTGSGKTLLARTLARVLNVPFSISDATSFTQAGYVGEDVEMCVQRLLQASNWDTDRASTGIIYIDEIDKLARRGASGSGSSDGSRDVGGEGVQQALLRMMEGGIVSVHARGNGWNRGEGPADLADASRSSSGAQKSDIYHVDTTNVLFICSGAFVGLEDLVKRRLSKGSIGFAAPLHSTQQDSPVARLVPPDAKLNWLDKVQPKDLVQYGFIPEFISRLPILTSLSPLSVSDLMRILTEIRGSLVSQYVALFGYSGVELRFTTAALREISRAAAERGGGARGLRGIMESLLLDSMFEVPGSSIRHVLIDGKVARGEEPALYWSRGEGAAFWAAWAEEEAKTGSTSDF